ncbi:MAG TPA: hypothetical protein VFN68_17625, partial [Acidimicrobiales bacterium]|nr:hypothetical protein [Acidimicrobiales bacterium]
CVAAAVLIAGRPVPAVAVLGALAATGAVAAAVAPQWPWPTVTLALLAVAYAVTTQPSGTATRIGGSVAMAALLWCLHVTYAAAAEVPRVAAIRPAAVRRWRRRLLTTLAPALPVTALTGLLGSGAPAAAWLETLGILAAVAAAALPGLLAVPAPTPTPAPTSSPTPTPAPEHAVEGTDPAAGRR